MVVKAIRGRRRYVAFTVSPSLTMKMLIERLNSRYPRGEAPRVIQCEKGWCIIRCEPKDVDKSVKSMKTVDPASVSLRTSGTLITLRKRYPALMDARPPRPVKK